MATLRYLSMASPMRCASDWASDRLYWAPPLAPPNITPRSGCGIEAIAPERATRRIRIFPDNEWGDVRVVNTLSPERQSCVGDHMTSNDARKLRGSLRITTFVTPSLAVRIERAYGIDRRPDAMTILGKPPPIGLVEYVRPSRGSIGPHGAMALHGQRGAITFFLKD